MDSTTSETETSTITTTTTTSNNNNNNDKQIEIEKNKYLCKEKCFLCKKSNPNPMISSSDDDEDDEKIDNDDTDNKSNLNNATISSSSSISSNNTIKKASSNNDSNLISSLYKFKKLPKLPLLWMCNECKLKCKEEEENKNNLEKLFGFKIPSNLDFFDIEIKKKPTSSIIANTSALATTTTSSSLFLPPPPPIISDIPSIINDSLLKLNNQNTTTITTNDCINSQTKQQLLNNDKCICRGCQDRRFIEIEEEKQNLIIQTNWNELKHFVRCIYRQTGTGITDINSKEDFEKFRENVRRLIIYEAHKLYLKLQEEVKEYLNESKLHLLQHLRSSLKTQLDALTFITLLLEEYESLCQASKLLANVLKDLEEEHLKRFHITWELDNKNLFRLIIFQNELIQNTIPTIMQLLKDNPDVKSPQTTSITSSLNSGDTVKSASLLISSYPRIYKRFQTFLEEMNVINVVWNDCKLLIDKYEQEQESMLELKEKILKDLDLDIYKTLNNTFLKAAAAVNNKEKLMFQNNSTEITATSLSTPGSTANSTLVITNVIDNNKNYNNTHDYIDDLLKQITCNSASVSSNETNHTNGVVAKSNSNKITTNNNKKFKTNHTKCHCDDCKLQNLIICGLLDSNFLNFNHDLSNTASSSGSNEIEKIVANDGNSGNIPIKIEIQARKDSKASIEAAAAAVALAAAAALKFDSDDDDEDEDEDEDENDDEEDEDEADEEEDDEDDSDDDDDDDDDCENEKENEDDDVNLKHEDDDACVVGDDICDDHDNEDYYTYKDFDNIDDDDDDGDDDDEDDDDDDDDDGNDNDDDEDDDVHLDIADLDEEDLERYRKCKQLKKSLTKLKLQIASDKKFVRKNQTKLVVSSKTGEAKSVPLNEAGKASTTITKTKISITSSSSNGNKNSKTKKETTPVLPTAAAAAAIACSNDETLNNSSNNDNIISISNENGSVTHYKTKAFVLNDSKLTNKIKETIIKKLREEASKSAAAITTTITGTTTTTTIINNDGEQQTKTTTTTTTSGSSSSSSSSSSSLSPSKEIKAAKNVGALSTLSTSSSSNTRRKLNTIDHHTEPDYDIAFSDRDSVISKGHKRKLFNEKPSSGSNSNNSSKTDNMCLRDMNSSQLHRHLRSRPHHYHVIESNVKEEKKYLKSEEEIIEAIKDYRSSLLPPEDNEITGCCCVIGGTSDKFQSKNFSCHCSYTSIAAVAANSSPINKNYIKMRDRLRNKISKKKELAAEIESKLDKTNNNTTQSQTTASNTSLSSTTNGGVSNSYLNNIDIDELVKYINGENVNIFKKKKQQQQNGSSNINSNNNNKINNSKNDKTDTNATTTTTTSITNNSTDSATTTTKKKRQRVKKKQQQAQNEKDDKKPIETKPPDQNMVQSNTDDLNKSKTDNENLKQDSAKVIAENFQNKNNKKAKKNKNQQQQDKFNEIKPLINGISSADEIKDKPSIETKLSNTTNNLNNFKEPHPQTKPQLQLLQQQKSQQQQQQQKTKTQIKQTSANKTATNITVSTNNNNNSVNNKNSKIQNIKSNDNQSKVNGVDSKQQLTNNKENNNKKKINDGKKVNDKVNGSSGSSSTNGISSSNSKSDRLELNEEPFTLSYIDQVFMPRNDIENLNETEKELEEFKRFCLECKPVNNREKVKLNLNDILIGNKNKQKFNNKSTISVDN